MKIEFPQASPVGARLGRQPVFFRQARSRQPGSRGVSSLRLSGLRLSGLRLSGLRLSGLLLSGLLLAALIACGGASSDEQPLEPAACSSDAECSEGERCADATCVPGGQLPSTSAGFFACSVVRCPASQPSCCRGVEASATGNESEGYASRNELVMSAEAFPGEVNARFFFDAPDQQGWVTFRFGAELDLDRLVFIGRHDGVADRFLSVNTNRSEDSGCAFGFQLEFRPAPGGVGPFVLGNDLSFNDNQFCYGNARPGRARELAFAIFSTARGEASLTISDIALRD